MKKIFIAVMITVFIQLIFTGILHAQLTSLPNGGNKRASVSEQVGLTDVTIRYNRPHVKGREGHIWGELVPVGYVNQGFGPSKAAPWRAGANENTIIEFSTDVKIEGQPLAAGKYGFFIAYDPNECTLIFSRNSGSWGSFYYKPDEDVLRVKVKPIPADKSVEWLKYEFADQTPASATVQLEWEKLVIPFKIDVDVLNTQITFFRNELRSNKGFTWQAWNQAAAYCAKNKTNLDEALLWANNATGEDFGGNKIFQAWRTKASVLDSLGRSDEATETMKKALPYGGAQELYDYAKNLAKRKRTKEAFEIYKIDYDKYPDQYIVYVGMARAYSAMGDYKKALTYAQKADAMAPDKSNKDWMDGIIKSLQEGQDFNLRT